MNTNLVAGPEQVMTAIRSLAGARVERTSLRAVASQVGMSPTGLSKFLDGAAPYQQTVGKLEAWYLQHQGDPPDADGPSSESVAVAVRLLARLAPPSARMSFVDELLVAIRRIAPAEAENLRLREYEVYLRESPIS
jgi:hypothetical protein